MNPRERTAYHEAGHVVAACLLGRSIDYASIVSDDDAAGHMMLRKRSASFAAALDEASGGFGEFIAARLRRQVEVEIMVTLAGGLTVAEITGERLSDSGAGLIRVPDELRALVDSRLGPDVEELVVGGDLGVAIELAEKVSGSTEETFAYIVWMRERTVNLIHHPRFLPSVREVVDALLIHQWMGGRTLRALVEGLQLGRNALG